MMNECLQFMATSSTGEQCVAVLITDGTPTQCDTTTQYLAQIVADGHAKGVTTYTLGLPGSDLTALNALAVAGGTNAAIDVSGGAQAFITALNNIRLMISNTTTTVVTSPGVISTPVPCVWNLPPAPPGTMLDPGLVNVELALPGGRNVTAGFVGSASSCANVIGPAWYYDNARNPTRILLCPNTCNSLGNSPGVSASLLFGCSTIFAM
jgi:hypothetical protein